MTKPVTSVAIMMLIEQQKLALEDPVSKFLPGFDNLQVLTRFNEADGTYETRPAKVVMTVRHLLTHTSGIGYAFSNPTLERMLRGTTKTEWEVPLLHEPGEERDVLLLPLAPAVSAEVYGFFHRDSPPAPLHGAACGWTAKGRRNQR